MLSSQFMQIADSPNVDVFRQKLVQLSSGLGFGYVNAILVVDRLAGKSQWTSIGNTPAGFEEAYSNAANSRRDPVLTRLKRLNVPVMWDRQTYAADGADDLWEEQAPWGYQTGIAMTLHLPHGRHFLFGVDRQDPLPGSQEVLTRLVADVQLMAVFAQDAAMRLLDGFPIGQNPNVTLKNREREILLWTMEGKSTGEVASILFISEHTVNYHLRMIFEKLDVTTKHQAVLKALRLGLIE